MVNPISKLKDQWFNDFFVYFIFSDKGIQANYGK